MVTAKIKGTKVVLKLAEGSQTISNCNTKATDEELYALGNAVSKLEAQRVDAITKVVETALINE
ncbi:MAG: hypothetical protein J6F30_03455 [Cellulosilyticum sp.]|nr:hypothetical protein [Cellulosilyticum sp.]